MFKKKKQFAIDFALTAPSIIDQVEAHGYTLSSNGRAMNYEKLRQATHRLRYDSLLTRAEVSKVWHRLNDQIVANAIELPGVK